MKWPWQAPRPDEWQQWLSSDDLNNLKAQQRHLSSPWQPQGLGLQALTLLAQTCSQWLLHHYPPSSTEWPDIARHCLSLPQAVQPLSWLLEAGLDANLVLEGMPLCHHCLAQQPAERWALLLNRLQQYGADLQAKTTTGEDLLSQVLKQDQRDCIRLLIEAGCPINEVSGANPEALALAKRCQEDIRVRRLMLGQP
ncbi:hypothetical protein [Balneatrix alpica]|uniref:hypothetical protein n=1 Tax=Balneatrix alpica TaxID=75684 RepID=UPI0027386BF2|nr:hypothetical protein [Balneatrix alpica]